MNYVNTYAPANLVGSPIHREYLEFLKHIHTHIFMNRQNYMYTSTYSKSVIEVAIVLI